MKHNLLGAVSTIAIGVAASGAAFAAPCVSGSGPGASGNTVCAWSCTQTLSPAAFATDATISLGTLSKWQSNASTNFVETLKTVKYTLSGSVSSAGNLTALANATSFSFSTVERFTFTAGVGAPSNFLAAPAVLLGSTPTSVFSNIASGVVIPYTGSATLGPSTTTITSLLAQWTGPGSFGADFTTKTKQTVSIGGGNANQAVSSTALGALTLTYSYTTAATTTSVPEPAGMAIIGVGLAGLGAIRRRRTK